ncbi:MAG: Flp pilus assembly protein CpaB [Candidatus Eremiobacteraeota bacterium]|jgi:pilus assembly protein CpaB|nr:Flp pilus assembly protein CpaB [Candidatus Eremiobacteraeota bacterium]
MNARRIPLIVGIILALGTGLLMLNYLTSVRRQTADVATRTVVVAARDIPARVPITVAMLATAQRPSNQVDPDALNDRSKAVGSISLITIPSGSVLTDSKIGLVNALALPRRLSAGLRAVSISIDRVKGVSGLIQPGDRVDIIAVPPRVGNETPRATTILRGVLVLAMGGETETARATPSPENQNLTTVTLAVLPKQADLLALADVNTTLRLALRAPQEPIRAFPAEPLQLGVNPQPPAAAPAPAPARAPAVAQVAQAPKPQVAAPHRAAASVPVIYGDQVGAPGGSQ